VLQRDFFALRKYTDEFKRREGSAYLADSDILNYVKYEPSKKSLW